MNNRTPCAPFELLAKLAENPKESVELVNGVLKLYELEQASVQPDSQLVARAMNIATRKGIRTPRYVKRMTDAELQAWIAQQS